jgi:acyl-CoA synthetase (AMP-forming)/AMP-acid ligase II
MPIENLFQAARENARTIGDQPAVVFVPDGPDGDIHRELTYAGLDRGARRIGAWLQRHCSPGDRVILLYPPGTDFVEAFFGCLYAGMIPVPSPLPGNDGRAGRLRTILQAADASTILTDSANLDDLSTALDQGIVTTATDVPDLADEDAWTEPDLGPDTLALLQFTSGSTSEPRGVMVSHASLWHNLGLIAKTFELGTGLRTASWLPHYHDMGLIGGSLTSIRYGGTLWLMSPMSFLRDPFRWLALIDRYDIEISPAPNFAYDLCVRRIKPERAATLDLSRWRHALNGAEPVDPATLRRFVRHFAVAGLAPTAMRPCYGMAEVGLLVTGTEAGRLSEPVRVDAAALERRQFVLSDGDDSHALVDSGPVPENFELLIVDPGTRTPLADGRIGEIWLRGPSVAKGYWGQPDVTAATFGAYTSEDDGPYLRTGDLGVCHKGNLFVTGRIKELIIVNGRNIYPQDLERRLPKLHPLLADGGSATFGVPGDGQERVVVVQELRAANLDAAAVQELSDLVKAQLSQYAGTPVANVCFVKRGGVLRTTSGKVRRTEMREQFRTGTLRSEFEDLEPSIARRYRAAGDLAGV